MRKKKKNSKQRKNYKYSKKKMWWCCTYLGSVAVLVGLRDTRSCTSSTTSYAGRKKSNPTEMLRKLFPRSLLLPLLPLLLLPPSSPPPPLLTHTPRPHDSRTIAADQCRHRTELLETRWPNERAGGPTGPCLLRCTHPARYKYIYIYIHEHVYNTYVYVGCRLPKTVGVQVIVVQRAELATACAQNGFSPSVFTQDVFCMSNFFHFLTPTPSTIPVRH